MGLRRPDEIDKTIYNLLMDYDVQARDLIMRAELMKVDFIPANLELSAAEIQMINEMGREQILKDKLEPVQSLYDFIVIDCPPSLSLLSVNALVASDEVIIPLQCEYFGMKGMQQLQRSIERVRQKLNPKLKVGGILPTIYKSRTLHSQEVLQLVKAGVRGRGVPLLHQGQYPVCRVPTGRPLHPGVRWQHRRGQGLPAAGPGGPHSCLSSTASRWSAPRSCSGQPASRPKNRQPRLSRHPRTASPATKGKTRPRRRRTPPRPRRRWRGNARSTACSWPRPRSRCWWSPCRGMKYPAQVHASAKPSIEEFEALEQLRNILFDALD